MTLKRVLRAYDKPKVIGTAEVQDVLGQHEVPDVNGVERAEEKSRPHDMAIFR